MKDIKEMKEELIEQGRNEAWEAVKKIVLSSKDGGMSADELKIYFGTMNCIGDIVLHFSATEVIRKFSGFQVGDEVIDMDGGTGVITNVSDGWITVLWDDGNCNVYDKKYYHLPKTGRHFPEVVELLNKMKKTKKET